MANNENQRFRETLLAELDSLRRRVSDFGSPTSTTVNVPTVTPTTTSATATPTATPPRPNYTPRTPTLSSLPLRRTSGAGASGSGIPRNPRAAFVLNAREQSDFSRQFRKNR